MFEFGHDQAAGLRARQLPAPDVRVIPLASLSQPAQTYELLCTLAAHLTALGQTVVIADGSANEQPSRQPSPGAHLGLLQVLQNPDITGLEQAPYGQEWLVMPSALGLQALMQIARLAGPGVALSRLAAPFAPGVCVLVLASAAVHANLFAGLGARVMVPVINQSQATLDAYSAVKQLHQGGVQPVLAPLADDLEATSPSAVQSVTACAQRHLGLTLDVWTVDTWGQRAQVCAITPPASRPAGAWPRPNPIAPSLWN